MVWTKDKEFDQIKRKLTDTIVTLCKGSLEYDLELSVEGLLGITLDRGNIVLVNIKEIIQNESKKRKIDGKTSEEPSSCQLEGSKTDGDMNDDLVPGLGLSLPVQIVGTRTEKSDKSPQNAHGTPRTRKGRPKKRSNGISNSSSSFTDSENLMLTDDSHQGDEPYFFIKEEPHNLNSEDSMPIDLVMTSVNHVKCTESSEQLVKPEASVPSIPAESPRDASNTKEHCEPKKNTVVLETPVLPLMSVVPMMQFPMVGPRIPYTEQNMILPGKPSPVSYVPCSSGGRLKKVYRCGECDFVSDRRYNYERHINAHDRNFNGYPCEHCGRLFRDDYYLRALHKPKCMSNPEGQHDPDGELMDERSQLMPQSQHLMPISAPHFHQGEKGNETELPFTPTADTYNAETEDGIEIRTPLLARFEACSSEVKLHIEKVRESNSHDMQINSSISLDMHRRESGTDENDNR